jgi:hypothetical protein
MRPLPDRPPEKHDIGKPQLDLLLNPGALEIAKALTYGAVKYGRFNYLTGGGLAYSRLASAVARHLTAWLMREDWDAESGLSHLAHAGASLVMLADLEARGLGVDDRCPEVTR